MTSKRYIGIDLHTDNFFVCYYQNDEVKKEQKYLLNNQGIADFVETLSKKDWVAFESTANSYFFKERIERYVSKVKVISPYDFAIIGKSTKKTDIIDAQKIAYFLSKDLIPEARLKSYFSQQIISLIHTRNLIVKYRTSINNKTFGILVRHGIKLQKSKLIWSNSYEKYVFCHPWSGVTAYELQTISSEVLRTNEKIKAVTKEIAEYSMELNGYQNIQTIPGIGALSASIILCSIDGIENFADANKLASFFGLVPKVSKSNKKTRKSRITKKGSKIARRTIISCTWQTIRYDDYLNNYYNRIKEKSNSKAAAVATSRKLLYIIFWVLKNNSNYESFKKIKNSVRA